MEDVGIGIVCQFGRFDGNLLYFIAIWFIFWLFGIFFPVGANPTIPIIYNAVAVNAYIPTCDTNGAAVAQR
jgi:hypothetical protein